MADQFILGQHEATLNTLVRGQTEIFNRLGDIENSLAQRQGERRVATFLWASVSGVVGTFAVFITKAWLAGHNA